MVRTCAAMQTANGIHCPSPMHGGNLLRFSALTAVPNWYGLFCLIQIKCTMLTKHQKTLSRIERKYGVGFLLNLYETFERSYYQTSTFAGYAGFKNQIAQVYNEASTDWKNFVQAQKTELL